MQFYSTGIISNTLYEIRFLLSPFFRHFSKAFQKLRGRSGAGQTPALYIQSFNIFCINSISHSPLLLISGLFALKCRRSGRVFLISYQWPLHTLSKFVWLMPIFDRAAHPHHSSQHPGLHVTIYRFSIN